MAVRISDDLRTQLLEVDPVIGGNASAYDYPIDPINSSDLTGLMSADSASIPVDGPLSPHGVTCGLADHARCDSLTRGRNIYVLDEPTTGLHFDDVRRLMDVVDELVDQGNTVVVIEHNLDLIKRADWVIDLGPEGGHAGGTIVATGTPEQITTTASSWTGQYLAPALRVRKPGQNPDRGGVDALASSSDPHRDHIK